MVAILVLWKMGTLQTALKDIANQINMKNQNVLSTQI